MIDVLGGQIMKDFVGLRAKTYSYLNDKNDEDKKGGKKGNLNFKIAKTV